jgi:DNA-binding transcriptional LysR family regulator
MTLDTTTLQSFISVASTGSFTKAAERIGRTQSAVSQQIAKLEALIGKTLIQRGKTIVLTTEGQIFEEYARKILAMHLEVMDRFKTPDLEGQIRFGLPEDFATRFLSDVLVDFVDIHPRIFLNIECDLTLNLFERFKKNEFDMVLVKMSRPEDFPNGIDVWSEKLEWVGNKNLFSNFLSNNKPLPLILSPQPCVYRSRAIKALEEVNIKWQVVFSSPSYNGTIAAVKAGLGITVLPKTMVPNQLQILNSPILPALSDTHISLLKRNKNNVAIDSFEAFVLKKLKSL